MIRFILIPCVLVSVLLISALADVPSQISYQGRLTDDTGAPVPDGSYNITFEIHEHDPVPMGEPLLWSSGMQAVSVTDGLFVYYLGSNVPLPASIFADDELESHYLRFFLEGSPLASAGVQLVTVPFAFHAAVADTAAYALSAPGGSGGGWVDDGSVVRLLSSSDKVGIGVSSPTERLVVGHDLGGLSFDDEYIVCGNGYHEGYSGYKLGFNSNNFAEMKWYGMGEELVFNTRSLGVNYLNALVLTQGKVGINNFSPSEPLAIGSDLGSVYGDAVQIGDTVAGRYSGYMFGEDADNRGAMLWINNSNEFRLGYKSGGTDYGAHLTLKDGEMILTGSGNSSVQLPTDAISADEILDEPGVGRAAKGHSVEIENTWTTLVERTCTFPASGYAVVLVTCEMECYFPRMHLDFGVTLNAGPAPNLYARYILFDDIGTHECWETFNFHEVFSVSSGANTFALVGEVISGSNRAWSHNTSITVMFFPTMYATKADGSPDDNMDFSSVTEQPRLYTTEAVSARADEWNVNESARYETDQIAALRNEFETQIEALRQEIDELKNDR